MYPISIYHGKDKLPFTKTGRQVGQETTEKEESDGVLMTLRCDVTWEVRRAFMWPAGFYSTIYIIRYVCVRVYQCTVAVNSSYLNLWTCNKNPSYGLDKLLTHCSVTVTPSNMLQLQWVIEKKNFWPRLSKCGSTWLALTLVYQRKTEPLTDKSVCTCSFPCCTVTALWLWGGGQTTAGARGVWIRSHHETDYLSYIIYTYASICTSILYEVVTTWKKSSLMSRVGVGGDGMGEREGGKGQTGLALRNIIIRAPSQVFVRLPDQVCLCVTFQWP